MSEANQEKHTTAPNTRQKQGIWHIIEVDRRDKEQESGHQTRGVQMRGEAAPRSTRKRESTVEVPLRGHWMVLTRGLWLALAVFTLVIFFANLPVYVGLLQTPCAGMACQWQQLTHSQAEMLQEMGLPLADYAVFTLVLALASVVMCLVVSTLIIWRGPDDRIAFIVALMLVTLGPIIVVADPPAASPWWVPDACLTFLNGFLLVLVFLLFPTGQFVPHWMRWTLIVFLVGDISFFFPDTPLLPNVTVSQPGWLVVVGELTTVAAAQLYRYRRVSSPRERQQTKWVVFGLAVPITVYMLLTVLGLFFPLLAQRSPLYLLASNEAGFTLPFFLPLTFGFAMLRSRLWDIDIIINRTLVYATLTVSVVSAYVLIVSSLSALLRTYSGFLPSVLATGLVAVLFHPLHARLQRIVNRLMYGERDDPYAVLSRLGRRLEATLAPESVLPIVVETIAQALKLPYVAIAFKQGDAFTTAASYGLLHNEPLVLPLVYHNETIGQLRLSPRAPHEAFTSADRRLLEAIASQAGVAAHTVLLTADLQRSRQQLVTTREEERRRLRRDLHDGLGPTLASMTLKLDAARNLLTRNPPAVEPLLGELKAQMQATIVDIRRLVYDLRPPALDELGLVSALREHTAQYSQESGVQVVIHAPPTLPSLPAAVEVAAYRVVLEALTNVARHAQARTCCIRLELSDALTVEVSDDGLGLPDHCHAGVGISSMRERAAELGGTCIIEANVTGGTQVLLRLPLGKE
jgi:signal transduction histidine kinase